MRESTRTVECAEEQLAFIEQVNEATGRLLASGGRLASIGLDFPEYSHEVEAAAIMQAGLVSVLGQMDPKYAYVTAWPHIAKANIKHFSKWVDDAKAEADA